MKFRPKKELYVLVGAIGVSLLGVAGVALEPADAAITSARTLVGVPAFKQEKTNWCWAASTQMLENYVKKGVNNTQCREWLWGKNQANPPCDNTGGTYAETQRALTSAQVYTTGFSGLPLASGIKSQIDANHPMMYFYNYKSGSGGHVVVIYGYEFDDVTGQRLWYVDPLGGSRVRASVSWMADNGNWSAAYTRINTRRL